MPLAIAKTVSGNSKIGDAAVTYAAQQSCPSSCRFKDGGGCYAENGRIAASATIPLNRFATEHQATALDVAEAEADAIDRMEVIPGRPMRLHTVGDCPTNECAAIVADASGRYMERGGGQVWTYTHAWREVDRKAWGNVSVLASCETTQDVFEARQRGYATALVVDEFPTHRRYAPGHIGVSAYTENDDTLRQVTEGGVKLPYPAQDVLPCPAQTKHRTCTDCRLCFDDGMLRRQGYSIGFAIHGTASVVKKARMALEDPDNPERRLTSRDHANRFKDEQGRWPTVVELRDVAGVTYGSAAEMLERMGAR